MFPETLKSVSSRGFGDFNLVSLIFVKIQHSKTSFSLFFHSPLFIIFHAKEGESPVDKALELSGTDVGGWNVVVKSLPGQQMYRDPGGVDRFKGERT